MQSPAFYSWVSTFNTNWAISIVDGGQKSFHFRTHYLLKWPRPLCSSELMKDFFFSSIYLKFDVKFEVSYCLADKLWKLCFCIHFLLNVGWGFKSINIELPHRTNICLESRVGDLSYPQLKSTQRKWIGKIKILLALLGITQHTCISKHSQVKLPLCTVDSAARANSGFSSRFWTNLALPPPPSSAPLIELRQKCFNR